MKSRSAVAAAGVLVLALAVFHPTPAVAAWTTNGIPLSTAATTQTNFAIASDGAGGAFAAWMDLRPLSSTTSTTAVRIQRVTGDGDIAPGWPVDGRLPTAQERRGFFPQLLADGHGGVFVAWHDGPSGSTRFDVYLQRLTASGDIAPGWPSDGVQVAPVLFPTVSRQASVTLVSDGAGGVLLAWYSYVDTTRRVFAQRVGSDGVIDTGWPAGGVAVCSAAGHQRMPRSCSDGDGGLIVTWQDGRGLSSDIYAQRLHGDGTRPPGWPADGVALCTASGEQDIETYDCIVPDGSGGAIVCWEDHRGADTDIYAQRILADGAVAPTWPLDGAAVCAATGDQTQPVMVSNGLGGAFFTWNDERSGAQNVYAADILMDGARATGWPADGLGVSTGGGPDLAEDGMGGVYIVYADMRTPGFNRDIYASRVLSTGDIAAGWQNGNALCTATYDQYQTRAIGDGAGGLIATWTDYRGNTHGNIYAARVALDGVVAIQVSLASAVAEPSGVKIRWYSDLATGPGFSVERAEANGEWLLLGPARLEGDGYLSFQDSGVQPGMRYGYRLTWTESGVVQNGGETWVVVPALPAVPLALAVESPHPAAGTPVIAFTLPSADPAFLEVFDPSGRREWRREVGALGPGRHQLIVDRPVPTGVHMVRLTQGAAAATCKAVVLR